MGHETTLTILCNHSYRNLYVFLRATSHRSGKKTVTTSSACIQRDSTYGASFVSSYDKSSWEYFGLGDSFLVNCDGMIVAEVKLCGHEIVISELGLDAFDLLRKLAEEKYGGVR